MNYLLVVIMAFTGISHSVCDVLKKRPFIPSAEWAVKNIILPKGSEIKGAFRLDLFPHAREVFECFDDPAVERITLQWGSRLGKTASFISLICKTAAEEPCPMAFSDADEKSVKRVIGRIWDTMEKVVRLHPVLPPRHLRAQDKIALENCMVHGAWSGSPASAADYGARIIVKNEASKMSKKKSEEAPFAELMDERAKGFANRKILQASTPTKKGKCYIERERLAGDNRRRVVPCPFCSFHQELVEGNGRDPGGMKWEKAKNGHSTPEIARQTAWYECCKCRRKIREEHRYKMLNAGLWVPEGCEVTNDGKITGKPLRPGDHASFGPLSSLHSLIPGVTLGLVAQKSVESRQRDHVIGDPLAKRRNFINSWMGLTWDEAPQAAEPNELAARLCVPGQYLRVCPHWVRFLTRGADVQAPETVFEFWWEVWGWGEGGRGCLVDYGVAGRDGMAEEIRNRYYDHADGGAKLRAPMTFIDSGNHANEMYAFCRQMGRGVLPCKGSSTSKFPTMFRLSGVERSEATADKDLQQRLGGLVLVEINHEKTNWWVENTIRGLNQPADPNGVCFPEELAMDAEFFRQWTSEYPLNQVTDDGYEIHEWKKRHRNEWRDAARYACAAAWMQTNNGQAFSNLPPRLTDAQRSAAQNAAAMAAAERGGNLRTPDGRPFFVGNR